MAKVLGETGRYVADQSVKKYQKQFVVIFLVFFGLAFINGYLLGKNIKPYSLILIVAFACIIPFVLKKLN